VVRACCNQGTAGTVDSLEDSARAPNNAMTASPSAKISRTRGTCPTSRWSRRMSTTYTSAPAAKASFICTARSRALTASAVANRMCCLPRYRCYHPRVVALIRPAVRVVPVRSGPASSGSANRFRAKRGWPLGRQPRVTTIQINPNATDADGIVTHTLPGPAGTVLPRLLKEVWPEHYD
jgi:hypothetical protein